MAALARASEAAIRVAPPPSPSLPVLEQLQAEVDRICSTPSTVRYLGDRDGVKAMQEAVAAAWVAAGEEQAAEIIALREKLSSAEAILGGEAPEGAAAAAAAGDDGRPWWQQFADGWNEFKEELDAVEDTQKRIEEEISIENLWDLSEENEKGIDAAERAMRARNLTLGLFRFLKGLQLEGVAKSEQSGDGSSDDGDTAVQLPNGEGIVAVAPLRARLKRLEAHAAAGCVEYQLFGESLATSDAFAAAAGADLPPEEAATALPTAFGRWLFRTMDQEEIDEMVMQLEEEEKESEVQRAQFGAQLGAQFGAILRRHALTAHPPAPPQEEEAAYRALRGGIEGRELPPFWLERMGELLRRVDGYNGDMDDEFNPVPMLLLLLCARQGSFEATAVYMVARALAVMNIRKLAEAQGLVAPPDAEKQVALREGELVEDVATAAIGLLVGSYLLGLVLGLVLLWQAGALVLGLLSGPPPDPLDF